MSSATAILLALCVPLAGAVLIALAGRISANLREAATLLTSVTLIVCVWSLLPKVYAGARPGLSITEILPGIRIAFEVEPLLSLIHI